MAIDPIEATFRDRMRALAHRGGAVTKRRYGNDPTYYREIGRQGGNASVAARRARIAAELDGREPSDAPIVDAVASRIDVRPCHAKPTITLADIMADCESAGAPSSASSTSYHPKRRESALAEESLRRSVVPIRDESFSYLDDEPWDPWSGRQ